MHYLRAECHYTKKKKKKKAIKEVPISRSSPVGDPSGSQLS